MNDLLSKNSTLITVVAANLIPVLGIALLGWQSRNILFFYWVENFAFVFFSFIKLLTTRGTDKDWTDRAFVLISFGLLTSGLCASQGAHIIEVFIDKDLAYSTLDNTSGALWIFMAIEWSVRMILVVVEQLPEVGILGLVLVLASHGWDFTNYYILRKGYRTTTLARAFWQPAFQIAPLGLALMLADACTAEGTANAGVYVGLAIACKLLADILRYQLQQKHGARFATLLGYQSGRSER